jgi:hypothetical protein
VLLVVLGYSVHLSRSIFCFVLVLSTQQAKAKAKVSKNPGLQEKKSDFQFLTANFKRQYDIDTDSG